MMRLILSGCNGKMGRDINTESHAGFPVYANPANCSIEADAIIDFSHPSALNGVLSYSREHRIPVVIATTGLSPDQIQKVRDAADSVPVFWSANMSLGISLFMELAKKAASILGNDFDVEILEMHHNQKVDAPSGTALMLADAVSEGLDYKPQYVFERHSVRKKREKAEIGISAIRGGTIVGEHQVIFAGHDEIFTISHSARSKEIFAVGAINAALFLAKQPIGYYTMADLVAQSE